MSYKRNSPQPVVEGGTGAQTFTSHGLLIGQATSAISALTAASTGTVLTGVTGSDPAFSATPSVTSITIANAPVVSTDGANKAYVDLIAAGFNFKSSCYAGTTVDLNAIYLNGASGVGATLTNAGALAAFTVDGVSPALNARILVKNQSSTFQNGIYTLTTVGSGAVAWVLTRASDFDTPAEIQAGDIVPVEFGTVDASTLWLQTQTVTTIGTDPIIFTQFFGGGTSTLTANSGTATASSGNINVLGGANIATSGTAATLTVNVSGTTNHTIQLGTGSTGLTSLANGSTGQVLKAVSTLDPAWGQVVLTTDVTGILPLANGGTNASSFAITDGTVYYDGSKLVTTATGTSGWVLTSAGAGVAPAYAAPAASSISITGDTGGAIVGNSFILAGGSTGLAFNGSGTTETLTFAGITANGGTVSLATDATGSTVNIGTGAGAKLVSLGSANGASSLTLNTGTGNFSLNGVGGSTYAIGASTTTGTITIGGTAQTGTMTLGSSSGTNIIAIGDGTGATTVNIANGATNGKTVNIATGAVANTVVLGSTNTTSGTTINSGSGGIKALGVASVAVANKNYVTINTSTGALGSDAGATSSISITGNSGGALTGSAFTFTGGTTGLTFAGAGTTETLGGTLVVSNGGTGAATLTGLVLGNGTSAMTAITYVPTTSFTPVLSFGGGTTGIAYTTQTGSYSRIGDVVTFSVAIDLTSKGSSTGTASISAPTFATNNNSPMSMICSNLTFGSQVSVKYLSSAFQIYTITTGGAAANLSNTAFANNTNFTISGSMLVV